MKTLLLLAMVIGLLVSGCAHTTDWARSDGTPIVKEQWKQDYKDCSWWTSYGKGSNWVYHTFLIPMSPELAEERHNKCMESKGYTRIEKEGSK